MSESKRPRGKYKTTNWADYNASLKARGSLTVWLDKDMQWYATVSGKRGRQRTFSDAAIQFCLSIKCLFGLALRQSLGLVESLLRLAGLDWRVPDFSTVCRRQKDLSVKLPYRPSTTALDLLVDSTGIKFLGEGEWKCKKHGAEYRRQWRKVHLAIDARTLDIRAIEVTDNGTGDAPMLPELLSQIPPDEPIASVGGDGAYDTKACHAAIALRNAQAIIPPRKNARAWKGTQAVGELTQRSPACLPAAGSPDLEEVERVPPTQPGGDENELLQTTGRAGHGQDVRASGDGVAHPRGAAQPIQPTRAPGDSGLGVSPSGVGIMPSPTGVVQQGRITV